MKAPFKRCGEIDTPFTQLSKAGETILSPESTLKRQKGVLKQSVERILGSLANGREKIASLKDFDAVSQEVKFHLENIGIDISGVEVEIIALRRQIEAFQK